MLNNPFCEEIPAGVQPGPALAQPEAMSPCPFAGCQGIPPGYSLLSGRCRERNWRVKAPARSSPGRGRSVSAHGNAPSGRAMNNLIGLIILAGAVSRPAGTMQRRFPVPLPPGVIASGTQAEPGEFPRTGRREAASHRRCPCSRRCGAAPGRACSGALSAPHLCNGNDRLPPHMQGANGIQYTL